MKRACAVAALLATLAVGSSVSVSAADTGSAGRTHPDGVVGMLNAGAQFLYSSRYSDTWNGGHDFQQYCFGLGAVATSRLSLHVRFRMLDQSPRRYQTTAEVRYFTADPTIHRTFVNPDGPIGAPVISIKGGAVYYDQSGPDAEALFETAIDWPVSPHLTVGAGYRHYDIRPNSDPLGAYVRFGLYTRPYVTDSAWVNPDGPVGTPVISLLGGGSSQGLAAEGKVLVPLTVRQTLWVVGRLESATDPDRTTYTAGIGASYYFQR